MSVQTYYDNFTLQFLSSQENNKNCLSGPCLETAPDFSSYEILFNGITLYPHYLLNQTDTHTPHPDTSILPHPYTTPTHIYITIPIHHTHITTPTHHTHLHTQPYCHTHMPIPHSILPYIPSKDQSY